VPVEIGRDRLASICEVTGESFIAGLQTEEEHLDAGLDKAADDMGLARAARTFEENVNSR